MEPLGTPGNNPQRPSLSRVLVVDDDPVVRQLLLRTLTKTFHCMADEAADGLEALNAISKTHYQLVLLDLRMPGMDGLQVLTHIRSMPAAAALPVIVLSATRADDVVRSAVSLGIVDF